MPPQALHAHTVHPKQRQPLTTCMARAKPSAMERMGRALETGTDWFCFVLVVFIFFLRFLIYLFER